MLGSFLALVVFDVVGGLAVLPVADGLQRGDGQAALAAQVLAQAADEARLAGGPDLGAAVRERGRVERVEQARAAPGRLAVAVDPDDLGVAGDRRAMQRLALAGVGDLREDERAVPGRQALARRGGR